LAIAPGIIVRSGTGGHRHLYWPLAEPVTVERAELANRRLAAHLGADRSAVCNAAAVLRPPGTLSFKRRAPAPVTVERLIARRHVVEEILVGVPELPEPGRQPTPSTGRARAALQDPLLLVEPAVYAQLLTGRVPGRDRKISCPFHALSVGRAVAAGVLPACSLVDASLRDRGGPR
jgi:hypothetical protein